MITMYSKSRRYRPAAILLAVLLALPVGTGLAFASSPPAPTVTYGYTMAEAEAGYLLFELDAPETVSTTAVLSGGTFDDSLTVDDFELDDSDLQAGLSLDGVLLLDDNEIELGFAYDGNGYLFDAPLNQIGQIDFSISSSAIENYSGEAIEVPIVAETAVKEKIPFGARLYREIAAASQVQGGMKDQYAATTDRTGDIDNSPYYQIYDFYELENSSAGDLTMLSNFRTLQQALGNTCGLTSALMLVDWYGMREGTMTNGDSFVLNELDLQKLRDGSLANTDRDWGRATTQQELVNVFQGLNAEYDQDWQYVSLYNWKKENGNYVYDTIGSPVIEFAYPTAADPTTEKALFWDIEWFLGEGIPIIVGSQTWGGHYQVIVGYDNMGTVNDTKDDVLILTDPYDTTDHKQDGFIIKSYERFIWDWSVNFDPDFDNYVFLAAWPAAGPIGPKTGSESIGPDNSNPGVFNDSDGHLIASPRGGAYYQNLAGQLDEWRNEPGGMYHTTDGAYGWGAAAYGADGLSGPLSDGELIGGVYRRGDHAQSPYYKLVNPYGLSDGDIGQLNILREFKTIQQATEFTCGNASMLMAMNHFEDTGDLTEIDLANLRQKNDGMPGTTVREMENVIKGVNSPAFTLSSVTWDYVTTGSVKTMDGPLLYEGAKVRLDYENVIPDAIAAGLPVMVMWHEWGGHWQVVIGYDDMGTADTQDDVLILADPYDTTDHNQDGYVIESFERLLYDPEGWWNRYDRDCQTAAFVIMYPENLRVDSPADGSSYSSGANFTISGTSIRPSSVTSVSAILKDGAGTTLKTYTLDVDADGNFRSTEKLPTVSSKTSAFLTVSNGFNNTVVPLTITRSGGGGGSSGGSTFATDQSNNISNNTPTAAQFSDTAGHWAKDAIDFVVGRGLFRGVTDTRFEPNTAMTRGMLVTVLGRMNSIQEAPADTGFLDVDMNQYYAAHIVWATANGIVTGYSDQYFGPDDPLTREQVATIMSRYAQFRGQNLPAGTSAFADQTQISDWAAPAVGQMQAAGIIQGKPGNLFDPTGGATRAEIATILQRYLNQYPN